MCRFAKKTLQNVRIPFRGAQIDPLGVLARIEGFPPCELHSLGFTQLRIDATYNFRCGPTVILAFRLAKVHELGPIDTHWLASEPHWGKSNANQLSPILD